MDKNIYLAQFYGKSQNYTQIPREWYSKYGVKRGLRNEDHTGVLVGLTRIADVVGYQRNAEGTKIDCDGILYYRGIDIRDLVKKEKYNGYLYEQACFLLLFGYLPTREELNAFCKVLQDSYDLPDDFLEMNLLRLPGRNLMNKLQHSLITLYNYDPDPDNTDVYQTLRKGLNIMSKLPSIAVYAYMSKVHYYNRKSLVIHYPRKDYSTAENILSMLRLDGSFTAKEAQLLDLLLFLHADHGGGTNSTFTNVVVSSTDTDIYSSMASSIGALKGPRHGGANVKVSLMMENIIDAVGLKATDGQIKDVIEKILHRQFKNHSGLVYGFGHAVYTLSDPRAEIMRHYCGMLAKEKGMEDIFDFYNRFEKIAVKTLSEEKGANMCSNVDYYSGFAYNMLGIPRDLYTPLFVISRIVGWLAHNIEHKLYDNRIVRPAAKYVGDLMDYIPMEDR
ncbi:citrate synthase [Megasphaera cerevisiae DSM 20462]|jgi:citrate synthase|uniref:Citrate synthase n=1 Tax=Megasphaera cerevisiae DSM 20462 TaxID=1122219 RepID=A0A0J6WQ84_9FIRM|nr:citrate synthase [Megasphaera cerevisiae]KMO85555.1 citrate synthase [Megasphaera cerevisiae DSM 20462]OKY54716.1 citrate synthase [Megasphaera cerevisiae]SKA17411.1 citrate synthase [Megasphaera cerevisiae DSM 20462]